MRWILGYADLMMAATAWADCSANGVHYWPPAEIEIGTQPIILVEGYARDRGMVRALDTVVLQAPNHRVPLDRLAIYESQVGLTQSAWTPKTPLKPGLTYALVLRGHKEVGFDGKTTGRPTTWRPKRRTLDYKRTVPVQWAVAQQPLEDAAWNGDPSLGERNYTAFGCGPAISQAVTLPVSGNLALVEVTVQQAKQTQRYLLPVNGSGGISIGHGMCSGEFSISRKGIYDAHFALLRADGTRSPAPKNLQFSAIIDVERERMNDRLRKMKVDPAFKEAFAP
jgi:hypothetical protein